MPVIAPFYSTAGRLALEIHRDRAALGRAAAQAVAAYLHGVVARQGEARVIFACAPSQDEFLAALVDPAQCGIALDWSRITAFHMDDYVGLSGDHPQSFRHYLRQHLLRKVPIGVFHPLPAEEPDAAAVEGPIATACPASILRLHADATLYIDAAAAASLST